MGTELTLRLTGEHAWLGEADSRDVGHLIFGANDVVCRAASALVRRPAGSPGPLPQRIREAVKLKLKGLTEGSLVLKLEIADRDQQSDALGLGDENLGEAAVRTALGVLDGSLTEFHDVSRSWSELASKLDIGERNKSLMCAASSPRWTLPVMVLDATVRARLTDVAGRREMETEVGERDGILYEADFEKRSARLRTVDGSSIRVRFEDQHSASVKEALRELTRLRGRVSYSRRTSRVVAVDLVEIVHSEQLVLGLPVDDSWTTRSVAELAAEQGVEPVQNIKDLIDETITDEEAEAFMAALEL